MTAYRVRDLHVYVFVSDGADCHTFRSRKSLWIWLGEQAKVGDTVEVLKPVEAR